MKANAMPQRHNGRADRIREFFANKGDKAFTVRAIAAKVEPGCDLTKFAGSLSSLAASGELTRVPHESPVQYRNAGSTRPVSKPPKPPAAKTILHHHCSLTGIPDVKRVSREQLEADLAAFRKRGGRIERLGPTQFFSDPLVDLDNQDKRAKGRASQRAGRARKSTD